MDFIIASAVVTDEVHFADKKTVKTVAGGAGIYALCGIKLWSDSVMPLAGVGKDYQTLYGSWYKKNGISMEGLSVRDEKTPRNIIQYFQSSERKEKPQYGLEHYQKMEATPEELQPYMQTARGVYLFKNSNLQFWHTLFPALKERKAAVLWEISDEAACPECLNNVRKIAEMVDIFSINITESRRLLGTESLDEVIALFKTWKINLLFLRRGEKGAVMITPEKTVFVPSVENVNVVDVTGGGNSSSGAVLYGYCCGYSLEECGRMGSIAAAMCLEQFGVPEEIDKERRKKAGEKLRHWEEKRKRLK